MVVLCFVNRRRSSSRMSFAARDCGKPITRELETVTVTPDAPGRTRLEKSTVRKLQRSYATRADRRPFYFVTIDTRGVGLRRWAVEKSEICNQVPPEVRSSERWDFED